MGVTFPLVALDDIYLFIFTIVISDIVAMAKNKFKPRKEGKNQKGGDAKGGVNPFEVHINRSKYDVLGQKRKEDRGLPGVARAKALKKVSYILLLLVREC